MKWRGLPFQGDMVKATRAGLKTETRRVIVPQPPPECGIHYMLGNESWSDDPTPLRHTWEAWGGPLFEARPSKHLCGIHTVTCPYGAPADGLYVREAWQVYTRMTTENGHQAVPIVGKPQSSDAVAYRADGEWDDLPGWRWRPSIHMPRWASRQGLILTDVAVERVQDITDSGAILEGISGGEWRDANFRNPSLVFGDLWDRINGPRGYGWDVNPFVWRLRFELTDELPPC